MTTRIHVGTSGWHYAHWRGPFYPETIRSEDMLDFYCQRLPTVEINSSFYHLPSKETFRQWKEQTPVGFFFSVKASRYITHMKKLKDPAEPVGVFLSHAAGVGSEAGPHPVPVASSLGAEYAANEGVLGGAAKGSPLCV